MPKLYKILCAALTFSLIIPNIPDVAQAASVSETPALQLQTILAENPNGVWTTQSWSGENITPNLNWTTLSLRDYYENGFLNFEVRSTGEDAKNFSIGLKSKRHGKEVTINWNEKTAGTKLTAPTQWKSFSLRIKNVVDENSDSGFSLDDFWVIMVSGVSSGSPLEFRNVNIASADDERQFPIVKVNQAGYKADGAKTAYISYFAKFGSLTGKTAEVVNAADKKTVFSAVLGDFTNDPVSGERVHIFDFSEVKTEGEYFIRIPDANLDKTRLSPRDIYEGLNVTEIESYKFKIEKNPYQNLLENLVKYYYFQRQGINIDAKYAGDFARENLHPKDVSVKKWSDRNNPKAVTFDISGGWYDAGDYGKYVSPAAGALSDLLFAYELYPEAFNLLQIEIPETDKASAQYVNAPGFLSEIKWELDMLLKFEHASKDGSFYLAANYDGNTIYIEDTLTRQDDHNSAENKRDLRSHLATASAAAIFAHAYLVYKDIPAYESFAHECLEVSKRAWKWLENPKNSMNKSIGAANRTYTFNDAELANEKFWAAGALYRAVKVSGGNYDAYSSYIVKNLDDKNVLNCFNYNQSVGYSHGGQAFLGFVHYLYENKTPNPVISKTFEKFLAWQKNYLSMDNWGTSYPAWGYWWGSNKMIAQNALTSILGNKITGTRNIPAGVSKSPELNAATTANYLLGINPLSFSYVSGIGENSVENIFSGIYSSDKRLDPYKIPAGYFTEGSNIYDNRHLSKFDGKCYLDSDGEYTTNENTIYGNAAMIFLIAAVAEN
ncbi:MAG: glycoside hydrolase family 9 protein [Clostridiales bacterium]|jgi:hypothetical protein|nr:glycoside hydrolase family 9 protein [Clostridiales bacterium]